jgi:hypothetical protein
MYPRVEDFRVNVLRNDDECDAEYGLLRSVRRGRTDSRLSGSRIALLLLVWIIGATLFGGISTVLLWTTRTRTRDRAWACKSGEPGWRFRRCEAEADNGNSQYSERFRCRKFRHGPWNIGLQRGRHCAMTTSGVESSRVPSFRERGEEEEGSVIVGGKRTDRIG